MFWLLLPWSVISLEHVLHQQVLNTSLREEECMWTSIHTSQEHLGHACIKIISLKVMRLFIHNIFDCLDWMIIGHNSCCINVLNNCVEEERATFCWRVACTFLFKVLRPFYVILYRNSKSPTAHCAHTPLQGDHITFRILEVYKPRAKTHKTTDTTRITIQH